MLLSLAIACPERGTAQQPGKPARVAGAPISLSAKTGPHGETRSIRVYKLANADANAIARVISVVVGPAGGGRAMASGRGGMDMAPGPTVVATAEHELTVAGTDEQLAVVEELLKQLDQPPAAPPRPAYFTLKYALPARSELTHLLQSAVSKETAIAFDPASRTILVRGSDADIAAVQQLVELIDKPRPVDEPSEVLELTFFFLKSPSTGLAERLSQPVPAFLEPVAQALAKNGFRNPSLMTPLIIRAQEDDTFSTSGALTDAVTEAAADRATQGKLARVVPELNFTNVTLEGGIERVRTVGDVNIMVRWNALEFAGIDREMEVSVQLKDVALDKVLRYVLDSAGGLVGTDVGYVFDEGVVVISTREDLREKYGSRQTPLQVSVVGKARILEPGKSAQLDVEAEVYLPASGGAQEVRESLFRVETALTLPLGEYVILAAGPVAPDVGQGIAMVVRAEVVGGSTRGKAAGHTGADSAALPPGAHRSMSIETRLPR
ncbi:MAG TPA: secretin N-terminal domain-containing protein [Phycisphaerae bacterium]|nr:secretin N-terminal domain-containing protein [Phycisphaerae bacterium]